MGKGKDLSQVRLDISLQVFLDEE